MKVIQESNMTDMFTNILSSINHEGYNVNGTTELENVTFQLPAGFTIDNAIAKQRFVLSYGLAEMVWYLSGSRSMEWISKFGSIWTKLTDDGITNNSAYGYAIYFENGYSQLEQIIEILKADPNSRRAVININTPHPNKLTTNDERCTIALQYLVRDGKLNATTYMRSNDINFGVPYDVFYFTMLQRFVAKSLGLEVGTYTHTATSLHMYDRDIDKLDGAMHKSLKEYPSFNMDALFEHAIDIYFEVENYMGEGVKKFLVKRAEDYGVITYDK